MYKRQRTHVLARRIQILLEQGVGGDDKAWDAEAALDAAVGDERLLKRMQVHRRTDALNGHDLGKFGDGLHLFDTRLDDLAIQKDGADAAHANADVYKRQALVYGLFIVVGTIGMFSLTRNFDNGSEPVVAAQKKEKVKGGFLKAMTGPTIPFFFAMILNNMHIGFFMTLLAYLDVYKRQHFILQSILFPSFLCFS